MFRLSGLRQRGQNQGEHGHFWGLKLVSYDGDYVLKSKSRGKLSGSPKIDEVEIRTDYKFVDFRNAKQREHLRTWSLGDLRLSCEIRIPVKGQVVFGLVPAAFGQIEGLRVSGRTV